ncbi:MAG: DUF3298 domain-containing protein, partial [Bacteroidales bacterium]|nr:DUF3298 domain-containing protein [Bacteroidales bacterium]
ITLIAYAQETDCDFEYRHYEGMVDHDTALMELMILNDEIKGSIVYPERSSLYNGYTTLYAERLEGVLDHYDVATLESYPVKGETGEYSGTFEKIFRGTYRVSRENTAKTFHLAENYEGSVAFKGYCINRDTVLFDTIDTPGAQLKLAILLPEGDSAEYIRNAILRVYFRNQNLFEATDNEILPLYCKEYFTKYIEANIDIYDGGHAFNWEMSGITSISMNRNGLLVYRADNYAYTGGAHGMGVSRFLVFDTQEHRKLEISQLFPDEAIAELSKRLENKYREMHYLDDDEPLSETGLFDDHIVPSPNYWITESSISFFYNPYELAPYAMGSITISLHSDQVKDLLREDAPVKRLGW